MNKINLTDYTLNAEFPIQIVAAPRNLYARQNDKYVLVTCLALLNNGVIAYCVVNSDNAIKPVKNIEVYHFSRLTRQYTQVTGGVTE
ncbi:hypothetical protein NGC67_01835 [Mammaliicoccus fleurettii]|uniref:hypothetical protein n=1 Tax=Mammaliicoccus fleurettii TaxID=150056 RepID=UPI002DB934AC|nr:hypothetical protein [Mammaliicoccus fleurettii]MEB7805410.1 hypothetical protein [Mammaliicoccus fleurettii]